MTWAKAGPGAPRKIERQPNNRQSVVTARIDFSEKAAVIRIAAKKGISIAELIRTYIAWGIEADSK